jgi:spermidine synthase
MQASDVLMIGCGGGSLATMLDRAGVHVTIVDINPSAFRIAHKYFGLPREVDCHVADGRNFLRADRHRYDAIVLDACVLAWPETRTAQRATEIDAPRAPDCFSHQV